MIELCAEAEWTPSTKVTARMHAITAVRSVFFTSLTLSMGIYSMTFIQNLSVAQLAVHTIGLVNANSSLRAMVPTSEAKHRSRNLDVVLNLSFRAVDEV